MEEEKLNKRSSTTLWNCSTALLSEILHFFPKLEIHLKDLEENHSKKSLEVTPQSEEELMYLGNRNLLWPFLMISTDKTAS